MDSFVGFLPVCILFRKFQPLKLQKYVYFSLLEVFCLFLGLFVFNWVSSHPKQLGQKNKKKEKSNLLEFNTNEQIITLEVISCFRA